MASAQLKQLAALPADWQVDANRVGSRFHLDPVSWYRSPSHPDRLPIVAQAVWTERRLELSYQSWKKLDRRVVDPLGLVLKGGTQSAAPE
jgi:predicted DNA-binding transcriptional regulator YafY